MKKVLLSVFVIASLVCNGQITITSSHMPTSGDTLRYSVGILDTAILLNFQNSGSNTSWNFSNIVPQRQGIQEYTSSAQTPYNSSVSNRIAEKLADTLTLGGFTFYDAYNFYTSNSSSYSLDYRGVTAPTGLSFPFPATLQIAQSFSDKDEIYQFPLSYQDRDSSTFNFVYTNQLIGVYFASSGYRINNVDSWGTLTTPFGTFNCIRVITDIVSYDTLSFGATNFGAQSHQREYKWLTTQFEIPALIVSGPVVGGNIIPNNVQYRDSIRNVPSLFAPIPLFNANKTLVKIGDTVEFTNSSFSLLSANYQWSISPSTFQYVNGTTSATDSITVVFNDTGYYDIQLIAINSMGRDTLLIPNYIRVDLLTSLEGTKVNANRQLLFPNPIKSNGYFFLTLESHLKANSIKLYNIQGKLIKQHSPNMFDQSIELNAPETPGLYFLKIETDRGQVHKRLIVN